MARLVWLAGHLLKQGGLLIMAIGFNLLEVQKIRVANMLPAVFIPLLYFMLRQLF